MTVLLPLLLILPLSGCVFVLFSRKDSANAFHVALFTLASELAVIIRLLPAAEAEGGTVSFVLPSLKNGFGFVLEANMFSLTVLLGVCAAFVIALCGLTEKQRQNRAQIFLGLYFFWNAAGLFCSNDIISFYIFFCGMIVPLFMSAGLYGNIRKNSALYLFFALNLAGALCLFCAMIYICKYKHGNASLQDIAALKMPAASVLAVWGCICAAFISRIPVWPFNYWVSSVNTGLNSSLACVVSGIMPLTGVYGFLRFWQVTIPKGILPFVPVMEIFCLITMLLTALIGLSHKDFMQKLFSFATVYYLLFLLAAVMLPEAYIGNIAGSLVTFLIVSASLTVLDLQAERACENNGCDYRGVLAHLPRLSAVFAFFVLVAVGLPLSSMFWNNFALISAVFRIDFTSGLLIMGAVGIVSAALLYELLIMRGTSAAAEITAAGDLTVRQALFFASVTFFLFLSFFDPLWFVAGD